jgi:hypothetical protein
MTTLLHDLRLAVRTLWKSPLFTMVAVVSLAIAIGANTAVYALIDALFLRSPAVVARANLGRFFAPEEDEVPDRNFVVVLRLDDERKLARREH